MRLPMAILVAAIAIAAATGCGGTDDRTPVACLSGAQAYLAALRQVPGEARLSGQVPLSACLPANQKGGDLAAVGTAMLRATTRLNSAARTSPGGAANFELGYLVGTVEERDEHTAGIHSELLRRLVAAARYSPGGGSLPGRFTRTYRRGQRAGRAAS